MALVTISNDVQKYERYSNLLSNISGTYLSVELMTIKWQTDKEVRQRKKTETGYIRAF